MVLKKKVRIILGFIFMLLAITLGIYFIILIINSKNIYEVSVILALLAAILAIIISLLNNVKLKKKWGK